MCKKLSTVLCCVLSLFCTNCSKRVLHEAPIQEQHLGTRAIVKNIQAVIQQAKIIGEKKIIYDIIDTETELQMIARVLYELDKNLSVFVRENALLIQW